MTPRMNALKTRIMAEGVIRYKRVADLAAAAGVGQTSVYGFFHGRELRLDNVLRLARAVGLEVTLSGNEPLEWRRAELSVTEPVTEAVPVKEPEKVPEARKWRILVVTRCSRPENLPEVCRSVRAAAKAAFCKIFHDVRLDAVKVSREALPVIAEAGADAAAWHIPAPGDVYMIGSLNAAIQENAQPGDWVIVLDDDTTLTPAAAKIVKKCHEADAGLLVWGAEAPDELAALREPRDLAGNCVGKVDFCNFAFRYETWQKCRFQVAAGGFADGTFVGDAIRNGAKVLYFKEKAGRYNALRGGRRG